MTTKRRDYMLGQKTEAGVAGRAPSCDSFLNANRGKRDFTHLNRLLLGLVLFIRVLLKAGMGSWS